MGQAAESASRPGPTPERLLKTGVPPPRTNHTTPKSLSRFQVLSSPSPSSSPSLSALMDSSVTLFSPSSSSPASSSLTFSSPLPSPRALSPCSPNSASWTTSTFSFSPRNLRLSPDRESPSPWDSPKPLRESFLSSHPPPRRRPMITNFSSDQLPSPKSSSPPTFYSILGVLPSATSAEIRAAYRKLARIHHPDVRPHGQGPSATSLFSEINEAHATLTDPDKRQRYDLELTLALPCATSPYRYPSAPPRYPTSSAAASPWHATSPRYSVSAATSPRQYTDAATGRVYPSMNSFYREWRNSQRH